MTRPVTAYSKSLVDIAQFLGAAKPGADLEITGLTHDSRLVIPGDLYVALPGFHTHGAKYAGEAIAQGATAILTDISGTEMLGSVNVPVIYIPDVRGSLGFLSSWFYDFPSKKMNLVGITGTNGKTTTAHLIDSVWRSQNRNTGLIGTIETRIRDKSVPSVRTTPEATDLQALFATMLEAGCSDVVMEVSSHALALGRINGSHFSVSVFTNLTQDHLDFHENMNEYFKAKSILFSPTLSDLALINIDDEYGATLSQSLEIACQTYSAAGSNSDWSAKEISRSVSGSHFIVNSREYGDVPVEIPLIGDHNIANALASFAVLVHSGVSPQEAATGLAKVDGVPGRLERIDCGQPFVAVVDYAHTPDAVERVLAALRSRSTGRIIGVLGCGGDRDPSKRPLMGAALANGANIAFFTSDNPRSENPNQIIAEMLSGAQGIAGSDIRVEADRAIAIASAVEIAEVGDVLLVAGKGHETGQEIMGVIKPFDDREVLTSAILRRLSKDAKK